MSSTGTRAFQAIPQRGSGGLTQADVEAITQRVLRRLQVVERGSGDLGSGGTTDLSLYATLSDLSTHAADTTSIHGVADTAQLVLTTDTRLRQTIPAPVWEANPQVVDSRATASVLTSARRPTFYPVLPPGPTYPLWGFRIIVGTLLAGSTVGISLYAVTMSGSKTGTMTKVTGAQVQASGAAAGVIDTACAAPVTLDFTSNVYFVGTHASNVGTLQVVNNSSPVAGVFGAQILGTSAPTQLADTATGTWPSTINILASPTNSTTDAGSAGAAAKHCWVALLTQDGSRY